MKAVQLERLAIYEDAVAPETTMPDEIVFYTHPMSRGRVARWMLEEVGRPYRTEIMGYGESMKGEAYRAINPMGKVPALRHGDTVVTETAAICTYLADAFPEAGLAPSPGSALRGPYYRWIFFGAGPLEAVITNTALGVVVPPERERMMGYGTPSAAFDAVEAAVSATEYLAGPGFTVADLYLGSQLGWGMMFGMIEKRPAFERYVGRLQGRAAAVRAREIDDALLPKDGGKPG